MDEESEILHREHEAMRKVIDSSIAVPARTIAVTSLSVPDLVIGSTAVALSKCVPQFIQLLAQRLATYSPPHFIPVQTLAPWPNNNLIYGQIESQGVAGGDGGNYTFFFAIYLYSGVGEGDSIQVVDVHSQTATCTLSNPPMDPGDLFVALSPTFSAVFDQAVSGFATSNNFVNYMWGVQVTAVASQGSSPVTIAAGSSANLQPGNLLEVARESGSSGVYEFVAVIQIVSTAVDSAQCVYSGPDPQTAVVGDMVGIYQSSAAGAYKPRLIERRRSRTIQSRLLRSGQRAQTASGASGPFNWIGVVSCNAGSQFVTNFTLSNEENLLLRWLNAEGWVPPNSKVTLSLTPLISPNKPQLNPAIILPLAFVYTVNTQNPPPSIPGSSYYSGAMPVMFNISANQTIQIGVSFASATLVPSAFRISIGGLTY